jgi:hypothetical protein
LIALAVIAGVSEGIVWVGNTHGWPGAIVAILVGGFVSLMVGGAVGVPGPPPLLVLVVFAGLFEGVVWGLIAYGWPGAILGGVAGFVIGHVIGILLLIPLTLVALLLSSYRGSHPLRDTEIDGP